MAEGDITQASIKLPGNKSQKAYLVENAAGVKLTVPVVSIEAPAGSGASGSVYQGSATGAGAIAATVLVPVGHTRRLASVELHLSAAPTTSENLTVTRNSGSGAAYDTVEYSVDPAAHALTDLVWTPDGDIFLMAGDAVDVAYTNTDGATYGLQIITEEV